MVEGLMLAAASRLTSDFGYADLSGPPRSFWA